MSLLDYHKSINSELVSMRNRVRDLLDPGVHWAEDGRHKEAILHQVLSRHIPNQIQLSSGFVRLRNSTSNQIDLMITNSTGPVLFKEKDFQIVTPNLVEAVIEIKTRVTITELREALTKLADNVSKIREERLSDEWMRINAASSKTEPWAGLFVFEECDIEPQRITEVLKEVANQNILRSIQAVCLGPNVFARFWTMPPEPSQDVFHPTWHCYRLQDLAFAYFLGNALWMHEDGSPEQHHWFPLLGGKEVHRSGRSVMAPPYS